MTDAELAILSIIAEATVSGYDLQKIIDQRHVRAWTMIGVKSVYYVVDKLEQQGLVEAVDKDARPSQRQYRITSAGIGILQTTVMEMLSSPNTSSDSFDMGLANLPVLKTSQIRHALLSYRNTMQRRYSALARQLEELQIAGITPFHVVSMFEHKIALVQAEMDWFDSWFDSWTAQAPPDPEVDIAPYSPTDVPRMQQLIMPNDPDSVHKRETKVHDYPEPEYNAIDLERLPEDRTTRLNKPTDRMNRDSSEQASDK